MFYEVIDRAGITDQTPAGITVEGVYLRKFQPDAETEKRLIEQVRRWALAETTTELNRHICYNHLTDYGWRRLLPVADPVIKDGEFFGALIEVEDEFELGYGLKKVRSFGLLTADGRSFGKTEASFVYSASLYGRSREVEYELVRSTANE